jgi:hypothetical protein
MDMIKQRKGGVVNGSVSVPFDRFTRYHSYKFRCSGEESGGGSLFNRVFVYG